MVRDDELDPDPELTRSAFPELTRCDHCGVLDPSTQPTLEFNHHPGDGWFWLHSGCRAAFVPTISEPIYDYKNRFIGASVKTEEGWDRYIYTRLGKGKYEPAPPDPPPGWLRSRFVRVKPY